MTAVIRVDVDGTVTRCDGTDLVGLASAALGSTIEIVACNPHTFAPFPDDQWVILAIDEIARLRERPHVVNLKAWSLYGRSPIVGTAFIALDVDDDGHREDLPDAWIEAFTADPTWVGIDVRDRMDTVARMEGCTWPQ